MAEKTTVASWLLPALIAGGVSLAGVWVGAFLTNKEIIANEAAVAVNIEANRVIELANLRKEILSSTDDYDFQLARLLLEYSLKPLDGPDSFKAFSEEFNDYMSSKVVESEKPAAVAAEAAISSEERTAPIPDGNDYVRLVEQFAGPDRLKISNFLIEAYNEDPKGVVFALITGILAPSDGNSYRVNLYIAFTLARVPGGWQGTAEQLSAILALRETPNYDDDTFKTRTDEAVENYDATQGGDR